MVLSPPLRRPLASLGPRARVLHESPVAARDPDDRRQRPARWRRRDPDRLASTRRCPRASDAEAFGAGLLVIRLPESMIHLPAARRRLDAPGDHGLLQDLPSRGLRDLAVPLSDATGRRARSSRRSPARATTRRSRRRRGQGDLRPGRTCAAAAAGDDRRRRQSACRGWLRRGHRARPGGGRAGHELSDTQWAAARATSADCVSPSSASAARRCASGRCATCSPTTGRSCSGRSPSTLHGAGRHRGSSWRCTTPATHQVVYHGSYALLRGQQMSEAYRSVLDISLNVPAGLLFRQVHHWAADVFVASIVLHLMRIFFTGAYRKPRDLNYYIGLTMLDRWRSSRASPATRWSTTCCPGWAWRSATGSRSSIPFIGGQLAQPDLGRPVPGLEQLLLAPGDRPCVPAPAACWRR